jgi:UDP-2,3-diacylglucosamine hydrolase
MRLPSPRPMGYVRPMVVSPIAFVASDLHLGAAPRERVADFHAWLDYAEPRTRHLVLNGDLFDFWFEYRSVIPRGATRTLGRLAALVDGGMRVDFVGGNHDWWGGSYLSDEIGLHVHRDPVRMTLGGHRTLVAHGDGLGRGDLGYRALRLLLRSRPTRFAFRWLHPDLGAQVARRVSRTELRLGPPGPRTLARSAELERWARDTLLEDDDLDAVVLGHTHLPRRVEVAPGRLYLNAGDWLQHCTWVEMHEGEAPRLMTWDGGRVRKFRAGSPPRGDAGNSPRGDTGGLPSGVAGDGEGKTESEFPPPR